MSLTPPPEVVNQTNLGSNQPLSINTQSLSTHKQDNLSSSISQILDTCILPSFCSNATISNCSSTALASCDECSFASFVSFGVVVLLLGLTSFAVNLLVLFQIVRKKNKRRFDKIQASLAVADMLTGFQPLVLSLNNLVWTMDLTANEFIENVNKLVGSPQSIAGGIFCLFGSSSSLYHLVFLSQQRVFALRWPNRHRVQNTRTVNTGLGIVWFLAALAAAAPACFTTEVTFHYSPQSFIYLFDSSPTHIFTLFIIFYILPFLMMICFMIYSAILIRRISAKSRALSGRNSDQETHNERESFMIKTIALMQIGFTITLVPAAIVISTNDITDTMESSCNTFSLTLLICFHFAMCSSLVNSLVYSIRDKEFRKFFVQCLPCKKRCAWLKTGKQVVGRRCADVTKISSSP